MPMQNVFPKEEVNLLNQKNRIGITHCGVNSRGESQEPREHIKAS